MAPVNARVWSIDDLASAELPTLTADDVVTWIDVETNPRSVIEAAVRARRSHRVMIGFGSPSAESGVLLESLMFTLSAGGADRRTVTVDSVCDAVASIDAVVRDRPVATATLGALLAMTGTLDVHQALLAESLAYSTLQSGPEYAAWLAVSGFGSTTHSDEPVVVGRVGDHLTVKLNRPDRHNAIDAGMRDALVDALSIAALDKSITAVTLTGVGRSFSSGGDLAEFGTTSDPATAHLIRTERRPGAQIHELTLRLGRRCEARVHGAVMGGGLELAAFAGNVVAEHNARFALPELAMGLIPGAGGTVSVARRIGRWRTAWMVVSGATLSAQQALDWGLVDHLSER